ncbi:MBL fold metallo-hydrolase [Acholeplasma laidlawii]|uniref:MBL fold metallo-hydrolase n=1 Tax=Acholeplasma laidlawii TaxID=2148 RepID=UPI000B9998E9|nr:MBL fold metallo-hydrolase [Acholeplasma laidlawii]PII02654.1 MBL fold metallo-hydrolase [Acholeplasma laidlawii]PII04030.1 MBL fold metallo-hydrolase [Acholeplasma laidlawii]
MEVFVLDSGSKGNITYVKNEVVSFFIDVGISYKKIVQKMKAYGEDVSAVNTLFLTHEHSDHIFGLLGILKAGHLKEVYLTQGTLDSLSSEVRQLLPKTVIIKADESFEFRQFKVLPILLSHDAKEPVGFRFDWREKSFVCLTDTGYVDESYHEVLKDADLYLLESNFDPKKLLGSRRPFALKQRILGIQGHLSNEEAAVLMNKLIQNKRSKWIVAHISEECNDAFDIEKAIVDHVEDLLKIDVIFASQESLPGIKL